jgi:hypothetical protein
MAGLHRGRVVGGCKADFGTGSGSDSGSVVGEHDDERGCGI